MENFVSWAKIPRMVRPWEITEKVDGTNGVLMWWDEGHPLGAENKHVLSEIDGLRLYAGSRTRWLTPEEDNHGFCKWALANAGALRVLDKGRHFGEWYGQGIQRGYGMTSKRFALFTDPQTPLPPDVNMVPVIGYCDGAILSPYVHGVLKRLRDGGSVMVPGFKNPEGLVVRHSQSGARFKVLMENFQSFDQIYGEPVMVPRVAEPELIAA